MSGKYDNMAARQEYILRRLQDVDEVFTDDLCEALDASVATIRRDLDDLEQRSLLRRTRGGAVPIGPLFYEAFRHNLSFQDKVGKFADEKRRIARAAAQLVQRGDTIALSGGTTTTELVRHLKLISGITVITNTVNVAMELSSHKDIEVVVTGGHLRGNWFTLVGPIATQAAQMLFADTMFIGVDGISAEQGLTCEHAQEAEFLRILARHSKRRIVVTDHSKLGKVSQWMLCPAAEIHTLVTDTGAADESIAPFRAVGIEVIRA